MSDSAPSPRPNPDRSAFFGEPGRQELRAALLIDWENFYLGREELCGDLGREFDYREDLDHLLRIADGMASSHGARTVVRRAYADFNTFDPRRYDRDRWCLQQTPAPLMERGIEPVQVFRFPGGANKNAADMRMTVDALRLVSDGNGIELFILVTGDADFIPLAIDLRRMGSRVLAIGVTDHTRGVLRRYCDDLEMFEDSVEAQDAAGESDPILQQVKHALAHALEECSPLVVAAVRPRLEKQGVRIDLERFGCSKMGDFLDRYRTELGIRVLQGADDLEVVAAELRQELAPQQPRSGLVHTTRLYEQLLHAEFPKIYIVQEELWRQIVQYCLDFGQAARDADRSFLLENLKEEVARLCADGGMEYADRKVNATVFQLRNAGCFTPDEPEGSAMGAGRWRGPVRLNAEVKTCEDAEQRARRFVVAELRARIRRKGGPSAMVDNQVLAELLVGPNPNAERVQQIAELAR